MLSVLFIRTDADPQANRYPVERDRFDVLPTRWTARPAPAAASRARRGEMLICWRYEIAVIKGSEPRFRSASRSTTARGPDGAGRGWSSRRSSAAPPCRSSPGSSIGELVDPVAEFLDQIGRVVGAGIASAGGQCDLPFLPQLVSVTSYRSTSSSRTRCAVSWSTRKRSGSVTRPYASSGGSPAASMPISVNAEEGRESKTSTALKRWWTMLSARRRAWWPGAGSNRRPSDFQSDARTN